MTVSARKNASKKNAKRGPTRKKRTKRTSTKWPASENSIEMRDVDSLIPYARNARTHSEKQIDQIVASIREWGWTTPCLISPSGGVIAGHGRLLAAKKLGIAQVPVIVARGWTKTQTRAYVLADNKLTVNAAWDDDLLRVELGELKIDNFDLDLTGFSTIEVTGLLAIESAKEEPAPPRPTVPVSREGDIWILGDHRLACGDATLADHVETLMGNERADVVFTDPPYGLNVEGNSKNRTKVIQGDLTQTAIPFSFDLAVSIATKGRARFYFCGGQSNLAMYGKLFDRFLNQIPWHLIWVKEKFVMKPNGYHNQYEIIFYGYKKGGGSQKDWHSGRKEEDASDVWHVKRDPLSEREHPTQKPVELPSRAIRNSCPHDGIVYDPFCGSGTTVIAAEQLGRVCYAMDLDPAYVDVTILRWQNSTGLEAVLDESDGKTFEVVRRERQKG